MNFPEPPAGLIYLPKQTVHPWKSSVLVSFPWMCLFDAWEKKTKNMLPTWWLNVKWWFAIISRILKKKHLIKQMGTFSNSELHFWEALAINSSDEVSEPVQSTMTLRGYSLHSSGFCGWRNPWGNLRRLGPKKPSFFLLPQRSGPDY